MNSGSWRHIPVVIWTDFLSADELKRYYQAGANTVMLKQDIMQDMDTFCRHWFKLIQLPSVGTAS